MINEYEILGRQRINLTTHSDYLAGRRILVTGAGGSIGSALCRRLAQHTDDLIMLDRDESALHTLQLSVTGRALLNDSSTILGDIRDEAWMSEIMSDRRPEIVFHAAALKHQPLLERYPSEAIKTNILGTWNVLRAAKAADVALLINVSTDKATDPTCVLGSSKRVAERLTASLAPRRYMSVRFGNVLGSSGSVLRTLLWQIDADLPLTVTDPMISRYFVTMDEAVDLLLWAGFVGSTREVMIMNMGDPIKISELARRLITSTGSSSEIVYTGIRSAEKIDERLIGHDEDGRQPTHDPVWHVDVPPLIMATDDQFVTTRMEWLLTSDPITIGKKLIDMCNWPVSW